MTDAGTQEPGRTPPRHVLPDIVNVIVRLVPFDPPRHRFITSALSEFNQALEFVIDTNGPLPLLDDFTPVLYVGETMLTEVQGRTESQYSFFAFELDRLEPGAPITLAYPGTPAEARRQGKYRYERPQSEDPQQTPVV